MFDFVSAFVDVDAEIIARGTVGFSGAELENLVNQAALKAAVDGKEMVTIKELEFAKDKIIMGKTFLLCAQGRGIIDGGPDPYERPATKL